ncbi:IPT/TIG domain-containing protein [Ereboglobus luteus]|uniref:Uncharacterized protein n=1 Tax=Ereboglobus luteus TaxID=1796921 RepID=A0A2U8E4B7_9BACT|nr:IPT/TIG domain-containing protein [Ereboglobus luteus]AWI09691.1 hypothetical protein CKA38_10895 [Ereboglobus luteus]
MLAGASGGRGWSGAWAANAGVIVTDNPDDIITYTMSDGTVLGGGKAIKLAADTPVSATLPRLIERDLAAPVTSGDDVFVSFIFKIKNPNAPDGELVPAGDNITSIWYAKDSDPNLRFDSLGYIGYSGKVGASMAAPTGATLVSTQLKTGQTYFAVVRYSGWDGSSYKKCRVWLNPATNDETAVSTTITNERTVTTAGVGSDSFLGLCVGGYGITSGGRYQVIDDIRVGYTWTAVTNPRTTFIASENFDSYAPGSKLAGAVGGTGWDGPWSAKNTATIIDDPADAVTYTLNDGTVRGGGSALKISGTGVNAATTVAAVLERRFARVPEGEDVYGSFVFKIKDPSLPDGTPLVGNTCALWYAADAAKDELRDIAAFAGYGGKAGGRLAGGWPTVTTPLVAGQSYLLVFRYSGWNDGIQAYDNCRVWLNPTTDDEASTDAAITVERAGNSAGYGNTDVRGLYVNTLGLTLNGAYHVVDDIRVGTDWASVVGEPTPSFDPGTPPQLSALPTGEFVAGDTITLAGNNFTGLTRVLIGGVEALVTASTDTTITVVIPENAAGGAVAVFTPSGCSIAADSLTIATQPSFVTNPAATQVAVEGRPVDLTADVWAHGAISYEWQYRANDTAAWETVPGSISVGAYTNELSLLMPDGKNGWQFRCVASTAAGSVEGTPVILTVIENLLDAPAGLVTGSGDYSQFVYVSDRAAHTVSVLSPNGSFALLAGKTGYSGNSDGNGDGARFTRPRGLAFSSTNSLIVADYGNGPLRSIALDTAAVQTLNATGPDAWLASPAAVATDAAGMTYIADTGNQLIKRLNADGVMEIFAGSAISGTDNGALLDAKFKNPAGLAVSTSGSRIYVADTGNHVIRLIDLSTGQVSTFAGQMASPGAVDGAALSTASFDSPTGIVLDSSGDLYVADSGNSRIRVITTNTTGAAEAVVTLAGSVPGFRDGPGKTAWFDAPEALAIGADGVLYVADTGNGIIRRIDTSADAIVSTPAMKTVTYPPSGGTDPDGDNGSGGGGGGGSTSIWFLLALAASAALRGRKK